VRHNDRGKLITARDVRQRRSRSAPRLDFSIYRFVFAFVFVFVFVFSLTFNALITL